MLKKLLKNLGISQDTVISKYQVASRDGSTEVFEIPIIKTAHDFAFIIVLFLADHKDTVNINEEK